MKKDNVDKDKTKVNADDGWNRALYGSPTIGGLVVVGILVAFVTYNVFFN